MKVVDRVETQDVVKNLAEEKKDDLFTDLASGKDATEEIETSRGRFTVKFPKPFDYMTIGKVAALRREYRPPSAFDAETEMQIMVASTLDVLVLSGPKWYEDAKAQNKKFSFADIPSGAFALELYGKAYDFIDKIEKRINPPQEGTENKKAPDAEGDADAAESGAFDGLSGGK